MRPILITGVNGFIASHLAERLLADGIAVRGMARRPERASWLRERGVQVVPGELLDLDSLRRAVQGCEMIVHAAAWTGSPGTDPDLAWRTNVTGTQNILVAAQENAVKRFIYLSSVAVYGLARARLVDETTPTPRVGQLYPDTKIAAEAAVRASDVPFVIVRPASTYGPRGTAWTLGPIQQIKHGSLVLLGRDTGLVTPGYIENVVGGLVLTLTKTEIENETFNLCDDKAVTYREFYLAYARMLGLNSLPTVPAFSAIVAATLPGRILRSLARRPPVGPWSLHFRRNPSQFSVERAKRLLGYRPAISFEEGMRRTQAWLDANGYL